MGRQTFLDQSLIPTLMIIMYCPGKTIMILTGSERLHSCTPSSILHLLHVSTYTAVIVTLELEAIKIGHIRILNLQPCWSTELAHGAIESGLV